MILFLLELKDKFRKRYPVVLMACAMVVTFFLVRHGYHRCDIDSLMLVQRMAVFGFLIISLLSIDFFGDLQKKDWKELLCTMNGGLGSCCGQRIGILLLFVLAWLVFITWVCCIYIWPFWRMTPDVRICITKALVLNFALFPIVGIFLGIFVNVFFKRFTAYVMFLVFLTSFIGVLQKFSESLFRCSDGILNLDMPARCFTLTQPNMDWSTDTMYLIPVEAYRFFLYFGWIGILGSLILLKLLSGKQRVVCVVLLWIACAGCFSQVLNPGGISNFNSNEGNGTGVGSFYEFSNDSEEYNAIQVISNDVTSYELDIKVRKALKATARMAVIPGKEEYLFTLYRGYELAAVTDQDGNPLEYTRNKDYITVSSVSNVSEIVMEYKGHSGAFFSNQRLIVLPAGFAWYPQSGHRPVYADVQNGLSGYNTDMQGYEPVMFHVAVDAKDTCFTNLQGQNDTFEGTAIGCTLVGGSFTEIEQNGVRIVCPSQEDLYTEYVNEFMKTVEDIEEYLQRDMVAEEQLQTLFLLPSGFQMTTVSDTGFNGEDHFVDDGLYSPKDSAIGYVRGRILVSGRLGELWYSMIREGAGYQEGYRTLAKESFFTEEEDLMLSYTFQFNMYKTLQSMGDETEVIHRILDYMQEDKHSEHWREFMEQYYLELEEAKQ